jgi:hypothetical protein
MTLTGDVTCAEKLLQPAKMVLKTGRHIRLDPFERRISLWNEIRTNYDRYMRDECGTFLEEVDLHMRSLFDAALVALASASIENNEDFSPVSRYSADEIEIWQKVERYNIMDIVSQDELRNRIMKRDADLLKLLEDYYLIMNRYVADTLDNPDIRITLRYYLKRRWNGYRGKMDAALSDAVTKYEWMENLVAEWEKDRNRT